MQFLIKAYDYKDALNRRLEVRQEHIEGAKTLMQNKKIINAAALIEDNKMVGSALFVDFENKEELNKYLENEPYVKNKVWNMDKIQILEVKILKNN